MNPFISFVNIPITYTNGLVFFGGVRAIFIFTSMAELDQIQAFNLEICQAKPVADLD